MDSLQLDEQLMSDNHHLQKCSFFLPHIGMNYNRSNPKVFVVGESHYLPKKLNNQISEKSWYEYDVIARDLIKGSYDYINTRKTLGYYRNDRTHKAFRIFYNMDKAYEGILEDRTLFESCVYLNYYQRPAEETGKSIKITRRDEHFAWRNLNNAIGILKPQLVLFASSKAYKSFRSTYRNEYPSVLFDVVPHPASAWWYKTSWRCSFNGAKGNGRDKFIRVMKQLHNLG